MVFHENRLQADNSHEISYLIFLKIKMSQKLSSATVVIGALRVKLICFLESYYKATKQQIAYYVQTGLCLFCKQILCPDQIFLYVTLASR